MSLDTNRENENVTYISTRNSDHENKNDNELLTTSNNIIFNNGLNNNEDYDKLKIFDHDGQSPGLTNQVLIPVSLRDQQQLDGLNLQQEIMQNGLQNTIAQISESKNFPNNPKRYKIVADEFSDQITAIGCENQTFYTNNSIIDDDKLFNNTEEIIGNVKSNCFDNSNSLDCINLENNSNRTDNHDYQIRSNSEAVELAIASEEEIPSPWIDVMALASAPSLRTESWSEFNAFPTAVHSLVDLAGPEPYPLELGSDFHSNVNLTTIVDAEDGLKVVRSVAEEDACLSTINKSDRNILHEITADADICKCVDCKCDSVQNCQNCFSSADDKNDKFKHLSNGDMPAKQETLIVNDFNSFGAEDTNEEAKECSCGCISQSMESEYMDITGIENLLHKKSCECPALENGRKFCEDIIEIENIISNKSFPKGSDSILPNIIQNKKTNDSPDEPSAQKGCCGCGNKSKCKCDGNCNDCGSNKKQNCCSEKSNSSCCCNGDVKSFKTVQNETSSLEKLKNSLNKIQSIYETDDNLNISEGISLKPHEISGILSSTSLEFDRREDFFNKMTKSDLASCLDSDCPCDNQSGGCRSCCVIICLKTFQQLQRVLNKNCCKDKSAGDRNITLPLTMIKKLTGSE